MKAFMATFSLMFSLSSFGAIVPVTTVDNKVHNLLDVRSEFRVNKEKGEAFVLTIIDNRISDDYEWGLDTYRSPAEGLSFDKNTSEIVIDVEGQRIVCANVKTVGTSIFRHDRISLTGNCSFIHKKQKIRVETERRSFWKKQIVVSLKAELL